MNRPRRLMGNSVVVRDLVVDFATATALVRALTLPTATFEGGTSVAVMGPSGCGKSTLLGLLAGLAVPTRGTVEIGGVMISTMSERQRVRFRRQTVGMVYQADNLLPHLTVEENVGLQLAICKRIDQGSSTDSASADPLAVLDRLGIGGLADRLPDQLSGGQRQRVAVARAIVHQPVVILADEPTGALDAVSAHAVIELLVEVHRDSGATLIVVTHDPSIAERLDRTIQLVRPMRPWELDRAR